MDFLQPDGNPYTRSTCTFAGVINSKHAKYTTQNYTIEEGPSRKSIAQWVSYRAPRTFRVQVGAADEQDGSDVPCLVDSFWTCYGLLVVINPSTKPPPHSQGNSILNAAKFEIIARTKAYNMCQNVISVPRDPNPQRYLDKLQRGRRMLIYAERFVEGAVRNVWRN